MQAIDEVKKGCRVAVAAAAVLFAGVSSADVVKELFPWFEIGETVDEAMLRGRDAPAPGDLASLRGRDDPAPREDVALKHLHTVEARAGLRAHELYRIVDPRLPTNDMAWVTLSVPDRKVLQMRRDIGCGSLDAAKKLDLELQAKFKPLRFEGGPKLLEIMKVVDRNVGVQLSDAAFGKEVIEWLKRVE